MLKLSYCSIINILKNPMNYSSLQQQTSTVRYTIPSSIQYRKQHCNSYFIYSFIHLKWIVVIIRHSVNDNVNNNEKHFIMFHGQINALESIIWNKGWSNIIQTMHHWVQRCHPELQLAGTNVLSNYASVTSGYCIVVWTRTRLSTLTLSQSWPIAIQRNGFFWNTTSLLFFAKSKSTQVIRIL